MISGGGISRLNYGSFLLYNAIASAINVAAVLVLGYFSGKLAAHQQVDRLGGGVLLALIVVIAVVLWYLRRRKTLAEESAG